MNKLLFYLERKAGGCLLKLLAKTIKFELINQNPAEQMCVYPFWHRNLLPLAMHRIGDHLAIMISSSKDGELIAGPVQELGYIPVRGSTTRQGSSALKEMLRLSKSYQLGITPDGPKGPAKSINPGIFYIALLAKVPIVPLVAEVEKEWLVNSWDKFRIPKPFTRIRIIYGDPIPVNSKDDIPLLVDHLGRVMDELEDRVRFTNRISSPQ